MPFALIEAVIAVASIGVSGALLIYLRGRQPDPNRGAVPSAQEYFRLVDTERRTLTMPYVGKDRRQAGAADAAAWRRAA